MKTILCYARLLGKIFFDFIPIIVFLVSFELHHRFYQSTFLLIISTILLTIYVLIKDKRVPYLALFICFETTLFGWLTIRLHNPDFLQIRDTLYDFVVGGAIVSTAMMGRPIIKKMFSYMFILDDKTWIKLSYSWGFVFLVFGIFNEIVRRNFHVSTWVDYKGVIAVITVVYGVYLYFKFRDRTTLNFK